MFSYRLSHWNSDSTFHTPLISFQPVILQKNSKHCTHLEQVPTQQALDKTQHRFKCETVFHIYARNSKNYKSSIQIQLRNTQTIPQHMENTESAIPVGGHTHTHRDMDVPIHTECASFRSPTPSASAVSLSTTPTPGASATPANIQNVELTNLSCKNLA